MYNVIVITQEVIDVVKIETVRDVYQAYKKLSIVKKALVRGVMQGLMWSNDNQNDEQPDTSLGCNEKKGA